MSKTFAVLCAALALATGAVAVVTGLQSDADESREAQVRLAQLETELNALQGYPWEGNPADGKSPEAARAKTDAAQGGIARMLAGLKSTAPLDELDALAAPLAANARELDRIQQLVARGRMVEAGKVAYVSTEHLKVAARGLSSASLAYEARAADAQSRARVGSAAVILALLSAFGFFFHRAARARSVAERLARENDRLLAISRAEALTDALTGLPNRRALLNDLEAAVERAGTGGELLLALFDLDGFKQYNDTFGHPAGDALLARLGGRLTTTMEGLGTAYRMGGDEFCVLAPVDAEDSDAIAPLAGAALSEDGEGFRIRCSYGVALVPREASSVEQALRLADQRMYHEKGSGRGAAGRESTEVLLRLLAEKSDELREHIGDVSALAELTAERLGFSQHDARRVGVAAALHDVGKIAIPDAILNKRGPLDDEEWEFMRRHTVIGEHILRAAPSLAHTAELVRASHEWVDGSGYPDGLRGDEIPLGARVISVCDAFDAMVSDRPYRRARSVAEALAELRTCAGMQFDERVVEVLVGLVEERALGSPTWPSSAARRSSSPAPPAA